MRPDSRGYLRAIRPDGQRFECSRCGRAAESDVLTGDDLLATLGWARADGHVLCMACRRAAGERPDMAARILRRI
jgi:hypothetical protein